MTEVSDRHGWIPYVAPMFAFLLLVELSGRIGAGYEMPMLIARVATPLALLVFFRMRGAYSELCFRITRLSYADLVVGILLAGLWIVPYLVIPSIRPSVDNSVFDPSIAGPAMVPAVWVIRMLGFACVTPVMEELFMRSFLMRYADAFDTDADFRKLPIGKFTWRSFLVVIGVFIATHVSWEWWVMVPWAILTNLWFYYRKDLFAIVVVHAATNATILLSAIFLSDVFSDGSGGKLSLWFFV
ncbi:MAG: CPBP family glutamic-type intramembrane protease [Rubripirellula sp.]